jgi:serine/threonine protein kinase/Tol biopolymer transport system component
MSTHWEELEQVFAAARQIPAAEQAAFIARSCGTNARLRADAESLLSASNLTGNFMERPAIDRLAQAFTADGLNLEPGRRIGAYTIVRQLGFGGAGEVWRAKDERLDRNVAIKVLLPHLSTDTEKLRRFAEEARAAGTLNHPNILTVHDVGEQDGMPYLVSECLEGRNLRERLKAGPMPAAEAIAVALGIAQGLAAAHERGIVHRDLKPENTFLKSDGGVKLLDFGLAKLKLPTALSPANADDTALSLVAGTAAYMAPEQARGEAPDPRSDLFALGVMMYEMLAGQHPFRGASVFETLHAILTREPADLVGVNEKVAPAVARIVMRLLQKSPDARFQSARDLAWSLAQATDPASQPASDKAVPQPRARNRRWLLIAAPLAILAAAVAGWWLAGQQSRSPPGGALTRFTWNMPAGTSLDSAPAVAPDGRRIAFTAADADGSRLYVRALESLDAQPIAGTEGAVQPFWSPDGRSLGYFDHNHLMKVSLPDGAPAVVAEAPAARGGAWMSSGVIVYSPDLILSGLSRVRAEGGKAEPATLLDPARGETSHWWPVALPDGNHFLYLVRSIHDEHRGIYVGRLDGPAAPAGERLFFSDSGVAFMPIAGSDEADLVYVANKRLETRRINTRSLTVDAHARTLDFMTAELTLMNPLLVSASKDVLAFAESVVPGSNQLTAVDLDGTDLRLFEKAEAHNWPRVSPDGRLVARTRVDESRSQPDVLVEDLARGTVYPVLKTLEPDMSPVWSPDGSQLTFVTGHLPRRQGKLALNIVAADGTGVVRSLPCPGDYCEPTDWSADGSKLLLTVLESGNANVWSLSLAPDGRAEPLLAAEFNEKEARYSPDGRWVAYRSEEAGRPEVMVHAVSGPARRFTVSGEGGTQPVWQRDGKVLYYVDLKGRLKKVAVRWTPNGDPEFGLPSQPDLPRVGFGHWGTQYDVSPDGRRIYFMQPAQDSAPAQIQVAINWQELLD